MKELISLAFQFNIKGLLVEPSSNVAIQTFRALFVGLVVFIADASLLWLIHLTGVHYLISATFSFIAAVMLNYALSVKFVFKEKARIGKAGEIAVYFAVSLVGLGLTIVIMWGFTEIAGLFFMVSKVIATLIAFSWNFTARKLIIYRRDCKNEQDRRSDSVL